jgi:polysaccharide deacetylase 2 family uncharacterized protein YibQ
VLAVFCLLAGLLVASKSRAQEVIVIIDDIGYNFAQGAAVADLPVPVTMAVVPFSPHAQKLAELGARARKEIIVHSPMASVDGRALDEGGLDASMDHTTFVSAVEQQLDALPQAKGLNNHMGSQLTQNGTHMRWLMAILQERGLYFIDSRTSASSVGFEVAQAQQITSWSRDLFLDNVRDEHYIQQQLTKMASHAHKTGLAVAIGHPYPETLAALNAFIRSDQALSIRFVTPTHLLNDQQLAEITKSGANGGK